MLLQNTMINVDSSQFDDELNKVTTMLSHYQIEIGVISADNQRKLFSVGINNAELMYIHEHGSPIKNIPERPVLHMTLKYCRDNLLQNVIIKCINGMINLGWTEDNVKKELDKLAIRCQSYARKLIYSNDGRLKANAPSTIKRKGENHPLFDTGQLARSITCRITKI